MALKKCKECGGDVSTSAKKCPHCGAPAPASASEEIGKTIRNVLVVIVFFPLVFVTVRGCNEASEPPPRAAATTAAPAASRADDGKRWVTLQTTSNVRAGPGTEHRVVTTLQQGARYRCYPADPSDEWVKCASDEYIYRSLVKFDNDASTQPARQRLASDAERRIMTLRDEALLNIGWVAGNAYGHPVWGEVRGYVGEGGDYYDFYMRLVPSQISDTEKTAQYMVNKERYEEGRKLGSQQTFNESAATQRIQRVIDIGDEIGRLMRSR